MNSCPNIVVCLPNRKKVVEFREGLGNAPGIFAFGPESDAMWKLAGIDAFYLSLSRAERWGSRPIAPHTVAVLQTSQSEQQEGYPPFIITGFLLNEGEPTHANFVLPLLLRSVLNAVDEVNAQRPSAIRTLGFFAFELTFVDGTLTDSAHLLARLIKERRS